MAYNGKYPNAQNPSPKGIAYYGYIGQYPKAKNPNPFQAQNPPPSTQSPSTGFSINPNARTVYSSQRAFTGVPGIPTTAIPVNLHSLRGKGHRRRTGKSRKSRKSHKARRSHSVRRRRN